MHSMSAPPVLFTQSSIVGHGVDVVDVPRIERMLRDHGRRFRDRCFTGDEQAYAEQADRRQAERYAVRFAAKEAVLKALGTGWRDGISWRDVEVRRSPDGRPSLRLTGRSAEVADAMGIRSWHISLSHVGQMAFASVIACADGGSGSDDDRRDHPVGSG
jgi:holo-[acyl-carrier protein] synthase